MREDSHCLAALPRPREVKWKNGSPRDTLAKNKDHGTKDMDGLKDMDWGERHGLGRKTWSGVEDIDWGGRHGQGLKTLTGVEDMVRG